jgi:hypothetical protein
LETELCCFNEVFRRDWDKYYVVFIMVVRIGANLLLFVATKHQSHHPNAGVAAVAGDHVAGTDLEHLAVSVSIEQNCTARLANYTFCGLPFCVLVLGTVGTQGNCQRKC